MTPGSSAHEKDAVARRLAQERFERPLVIEAGAGTGKTTTLVARVVVWTLGPGWTRAAGSLDGASDDAVARRVLGRVAAITFTEAATAQMAHAVGEALGEVAAGRVPLGVDEARLPEAALRAVRAQALLRSLDQLGVRTIHAFCRRLLAEHALEAGLHPRFAVDADESRQDAIVRQVVEEALPELATGEAGRVLARAQAGPRDVAKALLQLVRDGVSAAHLADDPLASPILEELRAEIAGACAALREAGLERIAANSRVRAQAPVAQALLELERDLANAGCLSREALGAWVERVAAMRLDVVAKWSRELAKSVSSDLPGEGAGLMEAAGRLHPPLDNLAKLDLERLDAAWQVLGALHGRVEARLHSEGVETFAALLRDAQGLLAAHPEVRDRVRAGMDQLLVDEFQDTDRTQCAILEALALDRSSVPPPGLFLVGDPKQSIYGWRNADLAAYDAFKQRVRDAGGEVVALVVNHRSAPPILAEVERLVAPVMHEERGVQPAFEALVPSVAKASDPGFREDGLGPVEHWVSWDWNAAEGRAERVSNSAAARIEARALATDLLRLHRSDTPWSQIALLFRSGTDWDAYLDALRRARIPFAVEGDRSYYERREVLEAAAFLRLVLDPNDQMALMTWLRSPLIGVPDAALFPLWQEHLPDRLRGVYGTEAGADLTDAVDRAVSGTPRDVPGIARVDGWRDNLIAAADALGRLRETFDREPADAFVEALRTILLVEATEGARYLGPYRTANLDRFFRDLLASLARGDGDPQAVIRTLREDVAARREHEEGRPREAIEDAVQILTIHKAKGLDFEHVYLLQCHKGHAGREEEKAQVEDGRLELYLLGARTPLWHRARVRRARVERAEQRRTWYVALTRAKRRLVVAGSWPRPGRKGAGHASLLPERSGGSPDLEEMLPACAASGTHSVDHEGARFVFPALPSAWEVDRDTAVERGPEPPAVEGIVREAERLEHEGAAAREHMRRPFSRAVSQRAHESLREAWRSRREPDAEGEDPRAAVEGAPERDAAMAAGTAIHRALEQLDPTLAPQDAGARMRAALDDELVSSLEPADREAARARAEALVERFLAGPLYARFQEIAAEVVARELPVLLPPPPDDAVGPVGFLAGAVDLVYRDSDTGALVVADYKTDRIVSDGEVDAKASLYSSQGAGYVRAVQDALGLSEPPRFELWFLDADVVRVV